MEPTFYISILLFIATYALIISEKIHRTVVALAGAILMISLGIITQEQAIEGVDFNTLGLLIGMMIVVGIAKDCGMFQYVAIWASKMGKGKPIFIYILLGLIVAIFSAFLDNVTTVLLMVPVTFVVANNLKIDPKPFLIGTILLSNTGGTATLIGDPPNILIGSAANISFNEFLINLAPISLLVSLVTLGLLVLIYRKKLVATPEDQRTVSNFNPREAISDVPLLKKSLFVLSIILLGFFTHSVTHLEGATIALGGAALMLLLTMHDPEHHLKNVEWTTIFFFIGLFILVVGLEHVGVIKLLAIKLLELTQGNMTATTMVILWGSGIFSALIDNIPFVATMIPLVKELGTLAGLPLGPLWWALALGADIGGNATLVGASANVVVSGIATREGHKISFTEYLKIAIPITFVGLIFCSLYLFVRYLI
ncbi:MAG: ArsB/NhaD family transporter [Candidatus Magasanikbacteria bacterium]|nr:ArsB/NhaD family transporter [Candidatus Magasanikbacteria bacterium]